MSDKLRILVILPTSPLPIFSGGRQRMYQILQRLAARHRITVVSFWRDAEARAGLAQLAETLPVKVVPVPFARMRPNRQLPSVLGRRLWGKLRRWPDDIAIWRQPAMQQTLRQLSARQSFDLVQVEWPYLAPYALSIPQLPNILITHDIFSVATARRASLAAGQTRKRLQRQARLWQAYESILYARCGLVAGMSPVDADIISQRAPGARIVVLPNGVDTQALRLQPVRAQVQRLLFVGSPTHAPNIDAACWLLQDIWPELFRRHPHLRLDLINLDHPRVRACLQPGVELYDRQPALTPHYARSDIALVPLRAGSGTRLKILEAFAAGLPVISTAIGYEGLMVEPGQHLLQAESATDFIAGVETLLADRPLRQALTQNARQLVEQKYDWQQITCQYELAYQQLLRISVT